MYGAGFSFGSLARTRCDVDPVPVEFWCHTLRSDSRTAIPVILRARCDVIQVIAMREKITWESRTQDKIWVIVRFGVEPMLRSCVRYYEVGKADFAPSRPNRLTLDRLASSSREQVGENGSGRGRQR